MKFKQILDCVRNCPNLFERNSGESGALLGKRHLDYFCILCDSAKDLIDQELIHHHKKAPYNVSPTRNRGRTTLYPRLRVGLTIIRASGTAFRRILPSRRMSRLTFRYSKWAGPMCPTIYPVQRRFHPLKSVRAENGRPSLRKWKCQTLASAWSHLSELRLMRPGEDDQGIPKDHRERGSWS